MESFTEWLYKIMCQHVFYIHIQYTTSSQLESCLLCQIFYFYTEIPDGGSRETDKFLDIVLLDGGLLRRYKFTPRRRAHSQFGVLSQYIFQYLHNISASFSSLLFLNNTRYNLGENWQHTRRRSTGTRVLFTRSHFSCKSRINDNQISKGMEELVCMYVWTLFKVNQILALQYAC